MTVDNESEVAQFIKKLVGDVFIDDISQCDICSNLKQETYFWRHIGFDWKKPPPASIAQLKKYIGFGENSGYFNEEAFYILRCPQCNRLYTHNYTYESGGGASPSDEDFHVIRITINN